MNIIVINPANIPYTNLSILAEPIDALILATKIKNEYGRVTFIDMDVNRMSNNINDYLEEDNNVILFVYDYQIPLHTTEAKKSIFETIKNVNAPCKFIIVGKTSAYYYEEFIKNGIDVVFKSLADNITDVIKNIFDINKLMNIPNLVLNINGNCYLTEEKKEFYNFNDLPYPDRSLIDIEKYMDTRTMITSRGCVNHCAFCPTPTFFGAWSSKTASKVMEEIEYLVSSFNTKKILFLDDNMTINKERMYKICSLIKEKNIKCLFGCLSSINSYDKEMFKYMYECGFRWVHFGIESGSKKILDKMNKSMDIDYVKKVIKEVKEMGYRVRVSVILDYPGTTSEDVRFTTKLLTEIKAHEVRLHYLALRAHTTVFLENKDNINKTQYIHSNKPNIENNDIKNSINDLLIELKNNDYNVITEEVNYFKFNESPKEVLIASLTPIKYGMCWYE